MGYFSAEDDLMHDISRAGCHARESWLWTAPVPDEELLAFLYTWRTAANRWSYFVFVGGPDPMNPLYLDHAEDISLAGTDMDDAVIGRLYVRQPEPLHSAELAYEGNGLSLGIRFEGLHEPFSWHQNAGGCPDWVATDRYEQSCRTRGTLRLGDRQVEFTSAGHRDHSWGARNWSMLQHWKWINATADDEQSLHAMAMDVKGERIVQGYLNRDGLVSPLVSADAHADLDEQLNHRRVTADLVDEAGRTARLEADYRAGWRMPIDPLLLNEFAMDATIDGRPAVAHIELGWLSDYVARLAAAPRSAVAS